MTFGARFDSTRSFRVARAAAILASIASPWMGCHRHGHDEHGHAHPHGGADREEEEGASLAITRWTDRYELFVELPAPVAGKPVPYHAHVTRLDGFQAVQEGRFFARFETPSGVATEAGVEGVKRPGIFVFDGPAPSPGTYTLEMAYEHGGERDVFDGGSITVTPAPVPPEPEAPSSAITFLKESQWKVPFATAWAEERPLAPEVELSATVEPAGADQLVIAAPTGGRFFHNAKRALAEGLRVEKGDVLGSIAPNVAGDDFSRLELAAEEARLAKEQTERELQRVEPLVKQGLLPERRLIELRNDLATHTARHRSASGRVGRVVAPAGAGGVAIRAAQGGVVSHVLAPNGAPVEPGAPLLRLGGTEHLWIRARFVARPSSELLGAVPTGVRLPNGARVPLEDTQARFLSPLPAVDAASRIATWIADVPPRGEAAPADLHAGANVVLLVRIGAPRTVLAVPRGAVVDVDTRPFVFVQIDGEHFEKRSVVLGDADGPYVAVASGVAEGERVVTAGGFDIHLAAMMGTVESHRH